MTEIGILAVLGLAALAAALVVTLACGRWFGRRAAVAIPLLGFVTGLGLVANAELGHGGYSRLDWYAYAIFFALPMVLGGGIGLVFRPWRNRKA